MGRLIDADELAKRFCSGKADTEEEKTWCSTVRRMIKEQPTAYDVDKVVKWLDDERLFWEHNGTDRGRAKSESYRHAIELVSNMASNAYDTDSVSGKLKKRHGIIRSSADYAERLKDAYKRAIEIVRDGGVDDNTNI